MAEIGFRVIAANVSDCAAMAARPESALVQLVFPAGEGQITKKAVDLYKGISEACRRWTVSVIGGDLARGNSWTIGISMIGVAPSKARLLLRKGAQPGDALWRQAVPDIRELEDSVCMEDPLNEEKLSPEGGADGTLGITAALPQ